MTTSRSGRILDRRAHFLRVVGPAFRIASSVVMMRGARPASRAPRGVDHDEQSAIRTGATHPIQEPAPDDQQTGEIALPKRLLVVVEPLRAPEIMRALGLREHASAEHSESSVVLAGFPFASCASTSAQLHAADSLAGASLLKKWQQLDRTDSWWLPSLGGKKLRLALQPRSS